MNENRDTLEVLTRHLTSAMEPLRRAVSSEEAFRAFMLRLGWQTAGLPPEYVNLASAIAGAVKAVEALSDDPAADEVLDLLRKAKSAYDAIQNISTAPPGVDAGAFLAEIGERLFEILLTDYLALQLPAVFNLLSALNVIEEENVAPTAQKKGHIRTRFKWNEIPKILTEPLSLPERVYGWGTPNLRFERLLQHMSEFAFALESPVVVGKAGKLLAQGYNEIAAGLDEDAWMLKIPFYYITIGNKNLEAAFSVLELKGGDGKLPGLIIQPQIPQEFPLTFHLAPDIDLRIRAGTDLASLFGILIRPGEVTVKYPFQSGSALPSANFGVEFDFHPGTATILLGKPKSTRLQLQQFTTAVATNFSNGQLEAIFGADLKGLALVLAAGEADSFIRRILGEGESKIEASLGVEVSSRFGLHFKGSGAFEVELNPHLSLGPVSVNSLTIRVYVPQDPKPKAVLELGAGIAGELGPLKFFVEGIGLRVNTIFEKGNAGPLDIDLGFKPPNGIGLAIDAGVIKGGGFLILDPQKGEYAGGLELSFQGTFSLKAFGILNTKMPDGSDGFSLIIIITAEFGTGIQLGFGFTLLGVGGLLGLNRTMRLQPLMEGVRTGAINSIMFPQDIAANAQRIISDLRTIFPPQEGIFLVGPMAKIGWGTPKLISLSLGIIIEIPGNVAIVGVLRAVMPTEDAALLVLQVNFAGAIEFDKKRGYFFAALFESRVLYMTIEGEMGLLADFGEDPSFVLTVGGFHPQFNPPPLPFPSPRRVTINILNESNARIRAMCYYAVTSNTAQFGAHAELFFGFSSLSVEGHIGFDALLQFSPFYFIIEVSASVSLKALGVGVFSIRLRFALEGPTPWRARGEGSISFFFFSISADFDITWGESRDTTLPPIDVMPILKAEFEKLENWRALLPAGNNLLVSLRKLEATPDNLVLHPVGVLRISQRAVPLNLPIDKVGNQKPSDAKRFSVQAGSGGLGKKADALESFALAQFQDMDDAARLTQRAYDPLPGGVDLSVTGQQLKSGKMVKRIVRYEEVIIDSNFKRFARRFFVFAGSLFTHFLKGGAITKSTLSQHYRRQLQPFEEKIKVNRETFVVAFNHNNQAFNAEAASFVSEALARDFMHQQIVRDATLAEALHVIPNYEIKKAA
jgi:hypothetical protein